MLVLLKDDGILQYNAATNETVNDEFTISWWMNLDTSQAANSLGLAGINVGLVNGVVRRFAFDLGGGAALTNPHFTAYTRGPNTTNNLSTGVSMAGVWTHVAIVIRNDSSNTVASFFLNGNKLSNSRTEPLGTKFFPPSTHQTFIFGAGNQGNSVKGLFDSMQIADGTALTDPQVAAIAGQSDRLMTIATAAAVVDPFIENSSDFTLFGASSLSNDAGNLIYNHGTTGTDNYATGKWSDGLTHDGSGFSYTSYTLSFWVKFNSLPAPSQDVFFFSARDATHNGLEFMMDTAGNGSKTLQVYHSDDGVDNATRSLTDTYTSSNAVAAFQNVWINFVAVVSSNDENLNVYINESLRRLQTPNGYSDTRSNGVKYVNDIADVDSTFTIGRKWDGSNDHTIDIEIDSIQIKENVILTEAQANAMAADSTRQMTIETAAAISPYLEQIATKFNGAAYTNCTLSLDGIDDYATVSDGFRYTDFLSISLWFKTTGNGRIISSHIAQAGNNGFFIVMEAGGLKYRTPDQTTAVSSGPLGLNDGGWHHIVVTWTAGSRKLYVDNALFHTQNAGPTATGYVAGEDLYIGAIKRAISTPNVYDFFGGEIAKVEVLNEVLDAAAVTTRFNEGNGACP
jgi:hypothetical protein